ncbi:MAG: hypothetical protein ABFD50_04520 [Smithella sp.]
MEEYFKYGLCGFVAVSSVIYTFLYGPKPLVERNLIRQELIEDYNLAVKNKNNSLNKLEKCYAEADSQYSRNWAKSCKSLNNQYINTCLDKNIPEDVCKSKFVFQSDCSLPSSKADDIQLYLKQAKQECDRIFEYETRPVHKF